jgi:hypothetical protein
MKQNDNPIEFLKEWQDLVPDLQLMEHTAQLMEGHMITLRTMAVEDLSEHQFRFLAAIWATIASIIYLIWPYITDFMSVHPVFGTVLTCFIGVSMFAPLILLFLPQGEHSESTPYQKIGGTTLC